jgi:ATP phosphoribosyltransferase
MIKIALPKGRLGEKSYKLLADAGYGNSEIFTDTRKLIFTEGDVSYFLVKPSDVAVYVEHGAADIGFAGKDILEESRAAVFELADLGIGKCRMCVCGKADFEIDPTRPVKVATKFDNVARDFYAAKNTEVEIIHLGGSIEIAPLLGLSDVIVDIVETGTTLKENGLGVLEEIFPISTRLIANKNSYRFEKDTIDKLISSIKI